MSAEISCGDGSWEATKRDNQKKSPTVGNLITETRLRQQAVDILRIVNISANPKSAKAREVESQHGVAIPLFGVLVF